MILDQRFELDFLETGHLPNGQPMITWWFVLVVYTMLGIPFGEAYSQIPTPPTLTTNQSFAGMACEVLYNPRSNLTLTHGKIRLVATPGGYFRRWKE